jgi:hypothetical protein
MNINFEDDRMQSIEAANNASTLSEKVMQLKDLEDEIANAEESVKKLKEQARIISCIEIPQMMETMNIKKLKLKDGESVEVKKYTAHLSWKKNNRRLLNGFVTTVEVISLKTMSLLPLVVAKITRRQNMLSLHEVRVLNQSRRLV